MKTEFKVGDNVVHLSHGVGTITGIEERQFSPDKPASKFYILTIEDNGAPKKVFVPFEGTSNRVRRLLSKADVQAVYDTVKQSFETGGGYAPTWNMRYREYMELVHSGEAKNVATVLGSLFHVKRDKDLSFGERKLLDQALSLIVKELSLVENVEPSYVEFKIRKLVGDVQ